MLIRILVLASALFSKAIADEEGEILRLNVKTWSADIELKSSSTEFVPTPGLKVTGEVGWHKHGSSDRIDVHIDLAVIVSADEAIDPFYTTMVLWGLPLDQNNEMAGELLYEVGFFEY